MIKQDRGTPFRATTSGTLGGFVTASSSSTSSAIYYVTDISATASSSMGTWAVVAGIGGKSEGTVTLWYGIGTADHHFSEPLRGYKGGAVHLQASGTFTIYANIAGFYISS